MSTTVVPTHVKKGPEPLIERRAFRPQIVEDKARTGKTVARGLFAKADIATENGRVYPRGIYEREIDKLQDSIKRRRVAGELDHPGDGKTQLKRVSHLITGLEIQPNGDVIGEFEVLDSPEGLTLQSLVQAGMEVGVSSRGFGSVVGNSKGESVVQDDFQLQSFDVVAMPATEDAYPTFVSESKEPGGKRTMTLEQIREQNPDLVSEIEKSAADKIRQETAELISKTKNEMRDQVMSELRTDPKFTNSLLAMEELRKILGPFVMPEDVRAAIASKDEEIASLRSRVEGSTEGSTGKIEQLTQENRDLKAGMIEARDIAKELGLALWLERELKEDSNSGLIRMMIGDLKAYADESVLATRIAAIREEMTKKSKKDSAIREEVEKIEGGVKILQEELASHKQVIEESKKAIAEMADVSLRLGMMLIVEQAVENPNRHKVRSLIESGQVTNLDQVKAALKSVEPTDSHIQRLRERIQRGTSVTGESAGEDRKIPLKEERNRPAEVRSAFGGRNGSPGLPLDEEIVGKGVLNQLRNMAGM